MSYEANKRYRTKYPDKIRAANRKWNKANRTSIQKAQQEWASTPRGQAGRLVVHAKVRAKKLGVPFDLKAADVLFALELGVCEVTGLPFERIPKERNPFSPSLDRKIPALGYVKGNIQVVLWALNAARGTWGDDVLLHIAEALRRSKTRDLG